MGAVVRGRESGGIGERAAETAYNVVEGGALGGQGLVLRIAGGGGLALMRRAGVLLSKKVGREIYYESNTRLVLPLLEELYDSLEDGR